MINKEEFERLTPEQKRVIVALDVIAHLDSRQIIAEQDTAYLHLINDMGGIASEKEYGYYPDECLDEPMKNHLDNAKCCVCALGGMFLTFARVFDSITVGEMKNTQVRDRVFDICQHEDLFSKKQLNMIEAAFEESCTCCDNTYVEWCDIDKDYFPIDEDVERAVGFAGEKGISGDSEKILRAIMTNIIENKGEFRP